jgi:serine/threonine protein kinase/WD40 repeat protein
MTTTGIALLDSLRQYRLLSEDQIAQIQTHLGGRTNDFEAVLKELLERKWLTPFQVEMIRAGDIADLVLASWVLLERLGEGGMGQVYKARHRNLKRDDAIKVIRPECLTSRESIDRFYQEAQAVAALRHPNIVVAYDANEDRQRIYFAMEYVPGIDLARLVRQRGPLPVNEACDYARQAALGLQHAYEVGMIHRDIKPANLLRSEKGEVKILDLGLARLHDKSGKQGEDEDRLTQQGMMMGTPDYMAPEQAENSRDVDIRADIYSLGCTLYQLLAGQPPFAGGGIGEKLRRHYCEPPTPLMHARPDVPPALWAIVARMLAKRADQRFQTPGEVAAALLPFCQPGSAPATPQTRQFPGTDGDNPLLAQTMAMTDDGASRRDEHATAIDPTGVAFSLPPRQADTATEHMGASTAPVDRTTAKPRSPRKNRNLILVLLGALLVTVPSAAWWWKSQQGNTDQVVGSGNVPPDNKKQGKNGPPEKVVPKPPNGGETVTPNPVSPPFREGVARGPGRLWWWMTRDSTGLAAGCGLRGGPVANLAMSRTGEWGRSRETLMPLTSTTRQVVFSRDGSRAAIRGPAQVTLVSLPSKTQLVFTPSNLSRGLDEFGLGVGEMALSPDGRRIVVAVTGSTDRPVGGERNKLLVRDVLIEWGGPTTHVFFGERAVGNDPRTQKPTSSVLALAYAGPDRILAGTSELLRWNLQRIEAPGGELAVDGQVIISRLDVAAEYVAGSPGGQHGLVTQKYRVPWFYRLDARANTQLTTPEGYKGLVHAAVFLTEDQAVTGDDNGMICTWRIEQKDKKTVTSLHEPAAWHKGPVRSIAAASDGQHFVTGGEDGFICLGKSGSKAPLWKEEIGKEKDEKTSKPVWAVGFAAGGREVLYATEKSIGRLVLDGFRGTTKQTASIDQAKAGTAKPAPRGNGS